MTHILSITTLDGQIFARGKDDIVGIFRRQHGQGVGEHFEATTPPAEIDRRGDHDEVEVSYIIPVGAVACMKVERRS